MLQACLSRRCIFCTALDTHSTKAAKTDEKEAIYSILSQHGARQLFWNASEHSQAQSCAIAQVQGAVSSHLEGYNGTKHLAEAAPHTHLQKSAKLGKAALGLDSWISMESSQRLRKLARIETPKCILTACERRWHDSVFAGEGRKPGSVACLQTGCKC